MLFALGQRRETRRTRRRWLRPSRPADAVNAPRRRLSSTESSVKSWRPSGTCRAAGADDASGDARTRSWPSKRIAPPCGRRVEARDRAQQRGLSGAVGPEHGDEFAGVDPQRNAAQDGELRRSRRRVAETSSKSGASVTTRSRGTPRRRADRCAPRPAGRRRSACRSFKHHHAIAESHDQAHVVLDQEQCHAGGARAQANLRRSRARSSALSPAAGSSTSNRPGSLRDRAREFDASPVAKGEILGVDVAQALEVQRAKTARARSRRDALRPAARRQVPRDRWRTTPLSSGNAPAITFSSTVISPNRRAF